MPSCKFVSLLLLALVALAVAATLQSILSLKVPVLVPDGGARPAPPIPLPPMSSIGAQTEHSGGRIHLETPPSFHVRIEPLQGEGRMVAEIVWWATAGVAEQLWSISAQLLASLDPARLGRIERDWTRKSATR